MIDGMLRWAPNLKNALAFVLLNTYQCELRLASPDILSTLQSSMQGQPVLYRLAVPVSTSLSLPKDPHCVEWGRRAWLPTPTLMLRMHIHAAPENKNCKRKDRNAMQDRIDEPP